MYNYQEQRPKLFTESGVKLLLKLQKNIQAQPGLFTFNDVCRGLGGSSWEQMAALEFMCETFNVTMTAKGVNGFQENTYRKA